jgi:hypothetical protein
MNRWLARLAYTFLIFAGLLVWQAYREMSTLREPSKARLALYFVGAMASVGLAVRGMRARHRVDRE